MKENKSENLRKHPLYRRRKHMAARKTAFDLFLFIIYF